MARNTPRFNAALEPLASTLPAGIAEAIGRILSRHSYLEWVMGQVLYSLLEISIKQGRKVVRRPTPEQYVASVQGLFAFHELETKFDFAALGRRIDAADRARDMIAHSVYMRDVNADGDRVHLVRGSWALDVPDDSVSRDIWPEAPVVDRPFLQRLRHEVEAAIESAEALQQETDRQLRFLHDARRTNPRLNRRRGER